MNEDLLNKILGCTKIPSLPAVALRVIELTGDENVPLRELAATIENDQGLASRILKTVNSAFYGLSTPCSTISRAQLVLGLKAVKTLALGFTLVGSLKDSRGEGFDYVSYWRRAVYGGVAAKLIASRVRCADPEEAFLGGLLQDIGMLAFHAALGDEYLEVVRATDGRHERLVREELARLELQHPDVGAMLAARWRLPESLLAQIKYHERPSAAPKSHLPLVRCVALGNIIAEVLSSAEPVSARTRLYQRAELWFAVSRGDTDDILTAAASGAREVSRLFELDTGPYPNVASVLESANDRLVDLMLDEGRACELLAHQSESLQRALLTDELTGLASRRRFAEALARAFDRCRPEEEPISLVFIDADDFRRINDVHTRDVGDAALVALAGRLAEVFSMPGAVLARHAGEEFAVLLPNCDAVTAEQLAETCRRSVSDTPLALPPASGTPPSLPLTVSVGAATFDATTSATLERCERFVNAADQALRAAKKCGGNSVRVFRPKRKAA